MASVDPDLEELDKRIRQLKVEYEVFFVGGKKTPPTMLRNSVERLIQKVLDEKNPTFAQKFKLNTLISRFTAYKELWRKKTQEKEERGILRDAQELQRMIEHGLSAAPPPARGGGASFVTENPDGNVEQARTFYEFMRASHQEVTGKAFSTDFEKFLNLLRSKTAEIRERFRCTSVEFTAAPDEAGARVKFSARVKKY